MPRTREQFSEMKDERRKQILNAALPLFALHGNKVSIDQIAKNAKCSHGIFYHYYKNTDEILHALLLSPTYVELHNSLFNINDGNNYEKIQEIISILVSVSIAKLDKISYLLIIIKSEDKNSLFSVLTKLIKNAQISGYVVAGEPEELVRSIFFLFKGIYMSFLLEKHPVVKVPSLETVMQLIRKPISF